MLANSGTSASGETALDMRSMPNISTAKPSSTMPVSFRLSDLPDMYITIPISASTGVKLWGLSSCMTMLLPLMPVRLNSQDVTVVPTLAPMMM